MKNSLKNIQSFVIKYAEVISKVLRIDVEIVDINFIRIAGTGMYKSRINENIGKEGYVYKQVMKTGETQIVVEPGKHPICENCYKKLDCDETFEVSMPIKIEDEVIGVIGLVCFTEEQRTHMINNLAIFTDFLEQIEELISLKAREEIEKHKMVGLISALESVVSRVDQGVIITDIYNNIIDLNEKALKILNLKDNPLKIKEIKETGNTILGYVEYNLKIEESNFYILGEEIKVEGTKNDSKKIIIFTDLDSLKEVSTSMSSGKEYLDMDYIKGDSEQILKLKERIHMISNSSSTVMIRGESGTGKELFARAVHIESSRSEKPFVALNCAAIPDTLLESELFGYVKGAFTGADNDGKIGKIEFAHGGTLFLDEIGDMPIYLQSKLLRVLEEREIVRLGSNNPIPVDIRVIAATNKNLEELIEENLFREDLYYRLNVIPLNIPPLRDRKGDIEIITYFFVKKYSRLFNKNNVSISTDVLQHLNEYYWPGNVRELENTIEYAMNMVNTNGVIEIKHLPKSVFELDRIGKSSLKLENMEREYIKKALEIYGTSSEQKELAANELGIGIATLYRKIKKYNLS